MLTDCYERGHTADAYYNCAKCGEQLIRVRRRHRYSTDLSEVWTWHTQAELDRLWHGVDREAARVLGEEAC